jgi:hypothetical protein
MKLILLTLLFFSASSFAVENLCNKTSLIANRISRFMGNSRFKMYQPRVCYWPSGINKKGRFCNRPFLSKRDPSASPQDDGLN